MQVMLPNRAHGTMCPKAGTMPRGLVTVPSDLVKAWLRAERDPWRPMCLQRPDAPGAGASTDATACRHWLKLCEGMY